MPATGPGDKPNRPRRVVKRKPPPTPRQVRSSQAQANQYASQGRAVEKAANQQKARAKLKQVARTAPARPLATKPVRPTRPVAPKPLASKPPKHLKVVAPTPDVPQSIRHQQDRARRAKQIVAASRTGGDFGPTSARSGPNTDAAAARTARRIGHDITLAPDGHYYAHVKRDLLPDRHIPVDPFTGKVDKDWQRNPKSGRVEEMGVQAPALKIIDQTTRPSHAIAAGTKAAIEGKSIPKAVVRGAQLKDRTNFGDVLREAGASKSVASVAGFGLDVATDPLTYVTLGTGGVAAKAAEKVAAKTLLKAERAGMSEAGAKTVARAAAKQAEKAAAGKGSGVTVKVAGHEVPGVRRAAAATGRGGRKAARMVVRTDRPAAAVREAVREVRPQIAPHGVPKPQFQAARQAARASRASVNTAEQRAQQLARHLHKSIPREQYRAVIDAVERNDLSKLSPELAKSAHDLRSALKGARRESRRAGVAAGHKVGDTAEFLTSGDLKRLRRTVHSEANVQARNVQRAQRKEAKAQGKAIVEARYRLQAELAKPITQRRGIAALEARVKAAERGKGLVAPKGLSARGYQRHAEQTAVATRRAAAAKSIPRRNLTESHEQYLRRLTKYAKTHDLKLLERRATKLLQTVPKDVAKGYFPRDFDERLLKQLGVDRGDVGGVSKTGTGRKVARITSGYQRSEKRTLAAVNPERVAAGQVPFSTDVPLVALNKLKQTAKATSTGRFAQEMAKLGRPVKAAEDVRDGEAVYKLGYRGGQFGLHEVAGIPKKATKGGQYVALNRKLVKEMEGATQQVRAPSVAGRVFDKTTGTWKRVATATPGFHIRNIIGDVSTGYLAPGAGGSLRKVPAAVRATLRANEQVKALRPTATTKTVKVAGRHQSMDEFLAGARENGVLDAGYVGRELRDLTGAPAERTGRVRKGTGQTVERWMTHRENLMRLATYKSGLDRGLSKKEAADLANLFHVDYGELSQLERTALRRAFPFYTWTARSLPVMAKTLVQRPGKFANIEKLREETGAAFTGETEQQQRSRTTTEQQRQLPFVIKIGKGPTAISASLPATLLNELPAGKDPNTYLDELGRLGFSMLNPMLKVPIEVRTNTNTVFKRQIEDPKRPLVSAPAWVQYIPKKLWPELGITPSFVDKRTGKKTWGWRGRADYASRQFPGPAQVATQALGQRTGHPSSTAGTVVGALGVRVDELGPQAKQAAASSRTYQQLEKLQRRQGALNQQGINANNPTPEYTRLLNEIKRLHGSLPTAKKKAVKRKSGPLPLGGGSGGKLPLGGGSGGKLPL